MDRYDDILHLPHPRSDTHRQMTMEERAVQFAPFAVLSGLDRALQEAEQQHLERVRQTGTAQRESNDDG